MKEIFLTRGQVALVDDEDYEQLVVHKWVAFKNWHTFYAMRTIIINGKKTSLYMHREIMRLTHRDKKSIDHRDRNGLNNQKVNLREVSPSINSYNQKIRCDNSSGYRGVSWSAREKKWRSYINIGCHFQSCGYFSNPIDAALAYDQAAINYYKSDAILNFPRVPI